MNGIHSFYALNTTFRSGRDQGNYFLGCLVGDHANDEIFAGKLKKIESKLASIYGYGNFSVSWSSGIIKPIITLTPEQKFRRMRTKAYNIYKKECDDIIKGNSLFVIIELEEAKEKYENRIFKLQQRYFIK